MAKVSHEHDIPQIPTPVGSLEEVRALNVPTRNIATCSERDSAKNFGCPEHPHCDRAFRGDRPRNEIVRKIGRGGDVRTVCQACFVTVREEINQDDKGVLVQVIGGEGDDYEYRGSVKAHIKRDPNCNDCSQGKCDKWVDHDGVHAPLLKGTCPAFPAAATHPELVKFARRAEARMTGSQQRRAAMERKLLGGDDEAPEKPGKGGHARG